MDTTNKKLIGFGVAILLGVLLLLVVFKPEGQTTVVERVIEKVTGGVLGGVSHITDLTLGEDFQLATSTSADNIFTQDGFATKVVTGTCVDATTTVFSVINPFVATSTVSRVVVDMRTGTSTNYFSIGTSTQIAQNPTNSMSGNTGFASSTKSILSLYTMSSNTSSYIDTSVRADKLLATSTDAEPKLGVRTEGISSGSAIVGPYDYVLGYVTASTTAQTLGAITGTSNAFSCTYAVEFKRLSL